MRVCRPENLDKHPGMIAAEPSKMDALAVAELVKRMRAAGVSNMGRQEVLSGAMLFMEPAPKKDDLKPAKGKK